MTESPKPIPNFDWLNLIAECISVVWQSENPRVAEFIATMPEVEKARYLLKLVEQLTFESVLTSAKHRGEDVIFYTLQQQSATAFAQRMGVEIEDPAVRKEHLDELKQELLEGKQIFTAIDKASGLMNKPRIKADIKNALGLGIINRLFELQLVEPFTISYLLYLYRNLVDGEMFTLRKMDRLAEDFKSFEIWKPGFIQELQIIRDDSGIMHGAPDLGYSRGLPADSSPGSQENRMRIQRGDTES